VGVSGIVTAEREAVVRLVVLGPEDPGTSAEVEAVLDTGFTGHLTLPPEVVAELGLPLLGSRNSVLADGSRVALDVYRVRVLWEGRRRPVEVLATGGGALAGMSLIWGHRVNLSATEDGEVIIEALVKGEEGEGLAP
jgi:clan AA aspartic protease